MLHVMSTYVRMEECVNNWPETISVTVHLNIRALFVKIKVAI